MKQEANQPTVDSGDSRIFSGNIYLFHAFDIGEEIYLEKVNHSELFHKKPSTPPKYFKNYHIPLEVE
ncbi:MAG: hypothetical protein WBQ73_01135, partial [Candidatus Babeliales bacterium]